MKTFLQKTGDPSIRKAILAGMLGSLILLALSLMGYHLTNLWQTQVQLAEKNALIQATIHVDEIQSEVIAVSNLTHALADSYAGAQEAGYPLSSEGIIYSLKRALEANPNILNSYTSWVPGARLDYDDPAYGDWYWVWWSRRGGEIYRVLENSDWETESTYAYISCPMQTLQDCFIGPYLYEDPDLNLSYYLVTISSPIVIDGVFKGIVCVDIDAGFFQKAVDLNNILPGSTTTVINQTGRVVSRSGQPEAFGIDYSGIEPEKVAWVDDVLLGGVQQVQNSQQRIDLFVPMLLPQTTWAVIVSVPESYIYREVGGSFLIMFLIAAIPTLLIMLGTSWYINRLLRPVGELSRAANLITAGKRDIELEIRSSNEFGAMAKAFNTMVRTLQENETRLEMLFETSNEGIGVLLDRKIVFQNGSLSRLFQVESNAMLGKCIDELVYPDDLILVNEITAEDLKQPMSLTLRIRVNEQTCRWVIANISLIPWDNRTAINIYLTDINEMVQAREQVREKMQTISTLRAIDIAITTESERTKVMEAALNLVVNQLNVDAGCYLTFNSKDNTLQYNSMLGFTTATLEGEVIPLGDDIPSRAISTHAIVSYSDIRHQEGEALPEFFAVEGFRSIYAIPLIVKNSVLGVFEVFQRKPFTADLEWLDFFETLARQVAIALDNVTLLMEVENNSRRLELAYEETIRGLAQALELRDHETKGHSDRVVSMTLALARRFGIEGTELEAIRYGALLHDVGKIGISDTILLKKGPLDDDEWRMMRMHPVFSYHILSSIRFLEGSLDIPYCHHERWDGTGYPRGLHGEEIPLAARIFAVVDVWDSILSKRPYKEAMPQQVAISYLESNRGKHFDPQVVDAFLEILHGESAPPAGKIN